jgi:hypothetical protein
MCQVAIVGDSTEVMGDVGGGVLERNFLFSLWIFANPSFLGGEIWHKCQKKRLHIPFFWGKKIIPKKKIPPLFDSDFENRIFFKYSKTFFIYITQKIIFFEKNNF